MEYDSFFWMAMQSSLVLGLIHGINPCGHSWLVLAPFVAGKKDAKEVSYLTMAFLLGTAVACIVLGASLGAISQLIPTNMQWWVEIGTGLALVGIGLLLTIRPTILHSHDHDQHEHHDHQPGWIKKERVTAVALFSVGFVNMIIPCPTVAIMYGYAIDSGNIVKATLVFAAYALTTAMAVAAVIYAIFKVTGLLHRLRQPWAESVIMCGAGVITLLFATISLVPHLA
ncbi:MAG: hypothetical protein C0613_02350 [Desulfobulbaceae bacterium]|nr:MAG: hypothetical protein C0613_02350 [Desulfobulbaceae bacterium]